MSWENDEKEKETIIEFLENNGFKFQKPITKYDIQNALEQYKANAGEYTRKSTVYTNAYRDEKGELHLEGKREVTYHSI